MSATEGAIVELVIVEARDLIAADWGGTSDPYVSVRYGNIKKHTKVRSCLAFSFGQTIIASCALFFKVCNGNRIWALFFIESRKLTLLGQGFSRFQVDHGRSSF